MKVEEVSGDVPGTTRVHQIDGKDTVDIGGDGFLDVSDAFELKSVERIALTCPWTEHSNNLRHIANGVEPFDVVDDPTVYCSEPDELWWGEPEWVHEIEHGDTVTLSGYRFEVIVIPMGYRETMFYNSKNGVLFSGDVFAMLPSEDLSEEAAERLRGLTELSIRDVYTAIGDPEMVRGRESATEFVHDVANGL